VHKERGKCTSEELCKIIERINPEIIFEEIHPKRFDAYYKNQSVATLETTAIIQYSQNHQIEHIPVDYYEVPDMLQFYKNVDALNENICNVSEEYCLLSELRDSLVNQNGFNYLNSDKCEKLFERLALWEENITNYLNDENLSHVHKTWKEFHDKREIEILKNIYNYSIVHRYNKAILTIGEEHRKSIIAKIQEYEKNGEFTLNWNYSNYDSIL
jgi:hypothetical protein